MKAYLIRLDEGIEQTLGHFTLYDGLEKVFECVTLELPYEDNLTCISCVNKGVYEVTHRYSEKYKNHLILNDVPNRRYILIHYGNYNTDTEGCILVGSRFAQVNQDSLLDITSSRRTLSELLEATNGEGFKLTIL
tara:strand:- start:770 stop:1174 length:405 start_codon:yes stop_codon:yes gene_type:complete